MALKCTINSKFHPFLLRVASPKETNNMVGYLGKTNITSHSKSQNQGYTKNWVINIQLNMLKDNTSTLHH